MKNNWPDNLIIQQYLNGTLEAKLMHQLEKKALEDPFLADALEGYAQSPDADHGLSILQRQLQERIVHQQENKKVFYLSWQRLSVAAAAAVLFISAGVLFWMNSHPADQKIAANSGQTEVSLTPMDSLLNESAGKKAIVKATETENSEQQIKSEPLIAVTKNPISARSRKFELLNESEPVVLKRSATIAAKKSAFPSNFITGKIISANDQSALPGVLVKLKGKDISAQTDSKGEFKLGGSTADETLQVAYMGYQPQIIKTMPGDSLRIALNPDNRSLSEVVVSGFNPDNSGFAKPADGWKEFKKYIAQNIKNAKADVNAHGLVKLEFIVGVDGKLSNFKILKGLTDEVNALAVKIIQNGPQWKPSTSGKPQEVHVDLDF
ncbi:carboxypeptidase-like regulatory domain-containing protein [Daejeonella oryzae]|uniref:carboxypeptidase-like regulatory domain-containing protein n=1 Tax=Daejeonella oryzae TaxID=1122943 RepID=UPI00047D6CE0|nr:carboxypeptidase-like regulatory domain-containing protein [Daejeonella oryzae]